MKKLITAIFLLFTTLTFSQAAKDGWLISTTVDTAGAGLTGVAILLPSGAVPIAISPDTLTDASTVGFEVAFGYVTQDSTTDFKRITKVDSGGTDWAAVLTDNKWTPLDPYIMEILLGKSDGYPQQTVWIRPILSAKQDEPITLYIRVRYI